MRFLLDAQLPPALANAFRDAGCEAIHVADIGLLSAADRQIWNEAVARSAVLVTKDRDFSILRAATIDGPAILWVRIGNTGNRELLGQIRQALPEIVEAIRHGETVVEFVGR